MKHLQYLIKSFSNKSSAGFSLIEVLISTGIVSVVALGVSNFTKYSMDTVKTLRAKYSEGEILSMVHSKLSNTLVCQKNFPAGANATQATINSILDENGEPIITQGQNYGTENGELKVLSISAAPEPDSSWLKVSIEFEKTAKGAGVQTIVRSMYVFAEINASNELVRCLGADRSAQDSLHYLACEHNVDDPARRSAVEVEDPDDSSIKWCKKINIDPAGCGLESTNIIDSFEYDEESNIHVAKCIKPYQPFTCATGYAMRFDSTDGTPNCQNVSSKQVSATFDTSAASCGGANSVGFSQHMNKIRINCQ